MTRTPPVRTRRAAVAGALGAVLLATGCGSSAEGGGASEDGVTLQAAQFTWTAAAVTNAMLAEIVEQHPELGVAGIETTQLDPAAAWAGAQRGDIDLLTEVALPNQQPLADEAAGEVSLVHETYGGAEQGWFVPAYAVADGGEAAGLTSVTELPEHAEAFDSTLYDADPGWVSTEQNAKRLEGYDIGFKHVTSSEAAELAQLERAYEQEEPILLYLYRPHWVFAEYDMVRLEEPTPYTEGCFTTGDGACEMPAYSAWTAARDEVQEEAPAFYALLEQFEVPLADMEQMLAAVDNDGEEPEAVAREWLETNADTVESWVGSAE